MDVHPPHEPVHSWRDALTHVGLMTVGLFIALMLEGLVEYAHHRHIVREARENIRHELRANQDAVHKDLASLTQNGDHVRADIATLYAMQAQPKGSNQHRSLDFHMEWNDLDETAWTTARDTGALSYMPYAEAQSYAEIYGMQNTVNAQFLSIFHRETDAFAPVMADKGFDHITAADYGEMIHENRITYVDLFTTRQLLEELDQQLGAILKKG